MAKSVDPDTAFENLDDESQYRYLLLESEMAEELFPKHYLDLELDPYQIFFLKLIRGRFKCEKDVWRFIAENEMEWVFDNGWIKHGNSPGISPSYWSKPNVLVLVPAAHGKTTVVSTKVMPVMDICSNPNARTQLIGKNETEAFSFSTSIRRELISERLVNDFGVFKPTSPVVPWTNQAFSVAQREWGDVRENFEFFGTNSHAALGKRSDRVAMDDIETPDTARTPDMRAKLLEWVRIGPMTSPRPLWPLDRSGRVQIPKRIKWDYTQKYWGVSVVGTIFHPEGLYAMLMRDPTFTCVKFDCYKDKKCTVALAPKMMTIEDLDRERKSLGVIAFNKRYRNIAYNEEEMAFRESWVRGHEEEYNNQRIKHPGCLDYQSSFEDVDEEWDIVLGFDPASGSRSRWSAYSAYVVLGYNPNDEDTDIHLIDYVKLQDNFDRMLDHLLDGNSSYGIEGFYSKYRYRVAVVESNAFGKWLVDNDRINKFEKKNVILPYNTGGVNKNDPIAGVYAMGSIVQNGKLRIPYKEESDKEKAEEFIKDLLLFPKGTNDVVMALWLATTAMKRAKLKYETRAGSRSKWYSIPQV